MNEQQHLIRLLITSPVDRQLLAGYIRELGYQVNDSNTFNKDEWPLTSILLIDENNARLYFDQIILMKQYSDPIFLPLLIFLPNKADSTHWLQKGFEGVLRMPLIKEELKARLFIYLRLREQTQVQFNLVYNNLQIGIYRMTDTYKIIQANPAFLKMFGFNSSEEILNTSFLQIPFEANEDQKTYLNKVKQGKTIIEHEATLLAANGRRISLRQFTIFFEDKNGKSSYFAGTIEDISHYKKIVEELKDSEEKFRELVNLSPYGIIIEDEEMITFANRSALKMLKAGRIGQLLNTALMERIPAEYQQVFHNRLKYVKTHRISTDLMQERFIDLNNNPIDVEVLTAPFVYEGNISSQIIFNDVTERNLSEKQILKMAFYDQLTGLSNRTKLEHELNKAIEQAKESSKHVVVIYIDIDDFKKINDVFGHGMGDALLKEFATRLQNILPKEYTVARIGGDEIVVLLSNINNDPHDISISVVKKVLSLINEPFVLNNTTLNVTLSIGLSIYPFNGMNGTILFKNADIAMYTAKKRGGNGYQFCTPELITEANDRTYLEIELREAMSVNQLLLHYQPKLSLKTGKIVGVEALLRWQHPQKGMIHPSHFIPLAETTGLIIPITYLALDLACKQHKIWQAAGVPPFPIAINLSLRHFKETNFEISLIDILKRNNISSNLIEFEITESTLMDNVEKTVNVITYFQSLGIKTSIDDFGTGYSSLSYLKNIKCGSLKIDQSFIKEITPDALDCKLIISIIEIAHNMNRVVIAEGVETFFQYQFLKEHGCDQIQGYLLSKPLAPAEIVEFIKHRHPILDFNPEDVPAL